MFLFIIEIASFWGDPFGIHRPLTATSVENLGLRPNRGRAETRPIFRTPVPVDRGMELWCC
jgi:hypothetical protein